MSYIIYMPKSAQIAVHPPAEIETILRRLGRNIRIARLRREMTQAELAERVSVSRVLISQVEKGNPKTSIAVYLGALWVLGLLDELTVVADPDKDVEGRTLERLRYPQRARSQRGRLSDAF